MRNRYDYLRSRYVAWCRLKSKTGNHYDPTTNTFNFSEEEWDQLKKGNKIMDTLKTTHLSYPELCTQLYDGTAATGVSGWGPSSKKNMTIDLNDDIEIPIIEESQSNTLNPIILENPKKKAKISPKLAKTTKFEDEMTNALKLMVQTNSGPSLKECKEKLNSLSWGATNPLHRKALGIFCESAKYREQWMLLDAEENEHWGAIGALDGTLVHVVIPVGQQARYRRRGRGECYQNVLGICNFKLIFTFVWAGWEGVAHDSRILTEVALDPDSGFPVPPPTYTNTHGYLTPYRNTRYWLADFDRQRALTKEEKFNHAHAKLRNVIERAYGVLKERFPILKQMAPYSFSTQ
ncbi:uncharacterized protein LOC141700042 [Apium graveolens]|uniref:uncharacterized protein LOC141700042 n=1 Tax=Apium graveolens TaxID=4045 RepID=UPI003D7B4970